MKRAVFFCVVFECLGVHFYATATLCVCVFQLDRYLCYLLFLTYFFLCWKEYRIIFILDIFLCVQFSI